MTLMMVMNLGFAWGTIAAHPRTAAAQVTWNTLSSGITWNSQPTTPTWNVPSSGITKDTY